MSPGDLLQWPEALPIVIAAPLVWLALRNFDRARARRLDRLVGPRAPALAADHGGRRRGVRTGLFAGAVLLALVAVLRPVWGESGRTIEPRGVDVVLCLDVSRSMLARDEPGGRLARAKREIRALAERVRGDRLGLVVFAGEARLLAPLTRDMESFAALVDAADPLSVRRGGTDLGAALQTALDALKGGSGDQAVVLLTDGEDLGGRGLRAAQACNERGIAVHSVGFGSALGSKIAVHDKEGGKGGETFLRDRAGGEVVSAMDPSGLRRIAETTGGEFVDAGADSRPLVDVYETRILPSARKSFEASERRTRESRFQWPLFAAFALWILELCLTDRKSV